MVDLKIDASEVMESLAELLNIPVSFAAHRPCLALHLRQGMWIMHMSGCNQIVCAYLLRLVLHLGGKATSLLHHATLHMMCLCACVKPHVLGPVPCMVCLCVNVYQPGFVPCCLVACADSVSSACSTAIDLSFAAGTEMGCM